MATEKRLIDANVVLAKQFTAGFYDASGNYCGHAAVVFVNDIENAPIVDAVEVVHGRWVSDEADVLFHCSECETQISTSWDYDDLHWNYCPNCGAKMDGDGNG